MAQERRSPFGELVRRYRTRLGMRQIDLVERTRELARQNLVPAPVSERTISAIEHPVVDPSRWRSPRLATVTTLAAALELEPGTEAYEAFVAAARERPDDRTPEDETAPFLSQAHRFIAAGREPHLARLRAAVDSMCAGSAGALFVSADPGTGKTSLIEEVCRQAVARCPELVVLWTECTGRAGTAPPHEPFRSMLRLMVGDLAMRSERERVSDANVARLEGRAPAAVDAIVAHGGPLIDRLLPAAVLRSELLEASLDVQTRTDLELTIHRQVMRRYHDEPLEDALYRVLHRYAGSGPVVLVLEDLHWADSGTLATLAHLLTRLFRQRVPILLVGSFRPGDLVEASGTEHSLQSVLRMTPRLFPDAVLDLSTAVGGQAGRSFVEAMVARSSTGNREALVDSLFERTAGLPLFVDSFLRLCEQGRLQQVERTCLDLPIPEEVQAVFEEQVQRLPEAVQRLLDAASVQGTGFAAEPLMRMFDLSPTEFIDMVDSRLVRQFRMLLPGGTMTVSGRQQHRYAFSHALLRDYLDSRLNDLERQHYHIRTAEALLDLYGPGPHEAAEAIALHFERGGDRLRAARAHIDAGDHALNHRDFDRARMHFERVSEPGIRQDEPSQYIHAQIGLGNVARREGRLPRAREVLGQALDLARYHNLPGLEGSVLESMAMVDMDAGDIKDGVRRLRQVIDLWIGSDDESAARALANLSYLLYGAGCYEEGIDSAERAREMSTLLGDQRLWLDAQLALANCWLDLGLYEDALAAYRHALDICDQIGDAHRGHVCLLNIALVAFESGDLDTCAESVRRVLESPGGPVIHLVGYAEFDLGMVAEARGEPADARTHYERSRQVRDDIGQNALVIDSLAGLLRVAVAEQDTDTVASLVEDIEGRLEERKGLDGVEHVGRLLLALFGAHEALGQEDRAGDYLDRAVAFLEERAAGIVDPRHRESYLTRPPTHRRIMELAGRR